MSVGSIGWKALYNAAKGYAKRAAKLYPEFVAGTANDAMASAMKYRIKNRPAGESWFKAAKSGFKEGVHAAEKHNQRMLSRNNGSVWQALKSNIKSIPTQISKGWTNGRLQAAAKGKYKWLGGLKGAMKGIGTRMPLIGTLLLAVTSLPDIFKATANEGIASGAAEVVKVGARVGGGTLGAAIGTALLGPIGGIAGYAIGDWLTAKVVGKSYSERKYEQEQKMAEEVEKRAEEKAQEAIQTAGYQQVPFTGGYNPFMMMEMQQLMGNGGNIFEQDIYGNPFSYTEPQESGQPENEKDKK